jgi:sialidase-1
MLNVRNESKTHRRLVTVSADRTTGWSKPEFDDALLEPICMGGIVRYSTEKSGGKNRILFSKPHNIAKTEGSNRKNVSVKLSTDEGRTWPVNKTAEAGWSIYSDLAVTQSGMILCFYGRGAKPGFAGDRRTLARFNLEWLTNGNGL